LRQFLYFEDFVINITVKHTYNYIQVKIFEEKGKIFVDHKLVIFVDCKMVCGLCDYFLEKNRFPEWVKNLNENFKRARD